MKKTIIIVLAVLLVLCAFTGCGRRGSDTPEATPGNGSNGSSVTPDDNNGVVNDGNGIIGNDGNTTDTDVPDDAILPEIGNDIEQGVDDVIDGVGDAIEGNDNNAAGGNTNNSGSGNGGGSGSGNGGSSGSGNGGSNSGDNARGRSRAR